MKSRGEKWLVVWILEDGDKRTTENDKDKVRDCQHNYRHTITKNVHGHVDMLTTIAYAAVA